METAWSISVGGDHIAFSINNGDVYASGAGDLGQLGNFDVFDSGIPVRVGEESFSKLDLWGYLSDPSGANWAPTSTAFGLGQTVVMRMDQRLSLHFTAPSCFNVDLGFNLHQHNSPAAVTAGDLDFYVVDEKILTLNGMDSACVHYASGGICGTTQILAISKSTGIVGIITVVVMPADDSDNFTAPKIAAGKYHTAVLRSDGTVWAWGDNSHWQLGAAIPSR